MKLIFIDKYGRSPTNEFITNALNVNFPSEKEIDTTGGFKYVYLEELYKEIISDDDVVKIAALFLTEEDEDNIITFIDVDDKMRKYLKENKEKYKYTWQFLQEYNNK